VDGVSLADSVFAADPSWPATESHLPTLLRKQTRRSVGHLPLSVVLQGEHEVARALTNEPASLVAADAAEPAHLRTLARALSLVKDEWLRCGSAGLAQAWSVALGLCEGDAVSPKWSQDPRPVLVVSGSRHQATARQLGEASADGDLRVVDLSVGEHDWRREAEICAVPLLAEGLNVALTTTFSPYRKDSAAANAEMLAQATKWVLEHFSVSGLVVTGGDVARAVCHALGTSALNVLDEVQPGIPAGRFLGGAGDGLRVITKAGGFGDALAIVESIRYIRGDEDDCG
jgi:uncharacterized protein YgbK (DUF1537 family)